MVAITLSHASGCPGAAASRIWTGADFSNIIELLHWSMMEGEIDEEAGIRHAYGMVVVVRRRECIDRAAY